MSDSVQDDAAALEAAITETTAAMIAAAGGGEPVTGARLIAAELRRQWAVEGYSLEHDVAHGWRTLVRAGSAYKWSDANAWPFVPRSGFKPKNPLRDLIRAGALFAAARAVAATVHDGPGVARCTEERDKVAEMIDALLAEVYRVWGVAP